ncbi:hypothetical protein [Amycolatopsis sp. DSM 110486]|uniref:hypothetical protein n=1 Tax=Amycolatopsis sp. DSM 110486 TaxID=2865832 RepID=UPI001C6A3891|nr:hypothetical protein [Amycolatopsis sp. DSM 110486]QYN18888.1 hypothetical protein K1T34_40285 [Amycolatopsis sp. DSM 110486]
MKKPEWFQGATWADPGREVVWRADEVEFIASPVVGDLAAAACLPDAWWTMVRESFAALAAHQTDRVGMAQAHFTKRVGEVFPGVDTFVDEWTTAHADVHWHNLSAEGHLIDWEDWGRAPRGLDAATLASHGRPVTPPPPDASYAPDAELIKELEKTIGRENILQGLGTFCRRFAHQNTGQAELAACWSETSGHDLTTWAAGRQTS